MTKPIKVFGNSGSPYTQKILALLRYRNIPYTVSWGDVIHNLTLLDIEPPKPVLLPTMVFEDENGKAICKTDTTPIIRYLEKIYKNKSVIPISPAISFLNYILEDFADEWTTKYMFHYRWHFDEDAENAKKMLVLQHKLNIDNNSMNEFGNHIADRQINRLWVVGSNNDTAELIDQSYKRYLIQLEEHLKNIPFMFGDRPSSSDFALYGQLTQLVGFDPTPRKIAINHSPRTVAWVNIMSDLSGLHDSELKSTLETCFVVFIININPACNPIPYEIVFKLNLITAKNIPNTNKVRAASYCIILKIFPKALKSSVKPVFQ